MSRRAHLPVSRRNAIAHIVDLERRRGWMMIAFLSAVGVALLGAALFGQRERRVDLVVLLGLGLIALTLAAGFIVRQVRLGAIAERLIDLMDRPDLIVWLYEREARDGRRLVSHIYVCSRRGERLRVVAHGAQRDEVIALLARIAPAVPRGFSRARDSAFERDPLSVARA